MRVEPRVPDAVLAAIGAPLAERASRVDAPLLQPLNLYLDLAGEVMRAQLIVVQAQGGEELCLRPDFTVPVAAAHIVSGARTGAYLYQGAVFRSGEAGAPEEDVQLGLERIGADTAGADEDMAALAWRAASAGGRQDLTLWLGDIGLFAAFLEGLDLAPAQTKRLRRLAGQPRLLAQELARPPTLTPAAGRLASLLAPLDEVAAGQVLEEVWALAGVEPVGGRSAAHIARRLVRRSEAVETPALEPAHANALQAFMAIEGRARDALDGLYAIGGPRLRPALDAWRTRLDALSVHIPADRLWFAPALGHDFDYYDGMTFEVRSDVLGSDRPVAVGGRYDGLISRMGGAATKAIGCMVRPYRAWSEGEA